MDHWAEVRRDAGWAVLLGPVRLALGTLGSLLLVRVMLARAGVEVVGLWSVLNVAAAVVALADVGFSQLLARELHAGDGPSQRHERLLDKRAAEESYRWGFWFVALPGCLAVAWLWPSPPYDRWRLGAALVVVAWAAVTQLAGALEAALLAAVQENAYLQAVHAAAVVPFLAFALAGARLDAPLEGVALGTLVAAALSRWLLARRAAARGLGTPAAPWAPSGHLRRAAGLARRGLPFFSLALGRVLREPAFRTALACLLGVHALGVFSVAFRASVVTRELAAGGIGVLYPALATMHRGGRRREVTELQATALLFLLAAGGAALGCFYALAEPILELLLGVVPEGVVPATRLLILWNLGTLLNVPFDYLLQAAGHERWAALSMWAQTLGLLALWPCHLWAPLDLRGALWLWLLTSLAAQAVVYHAVHRRLDGLVPVLRTWPVPLVLALTLAYVVAVVALAPVPVAPAVGLTLLFLAAALGVSFPLLSKFGRRA